MTTLSQHREDPALRKTIFTNIHTDGNSEQQDLEVLLFLDGMCIQTKPGEIITLDLDQTIELADFFFGTNVMKRIMDMMRRQKDRKRRRAKRDQLPA